MSGSRGETASVLDCLPARGREATATVLRDRPVLLKRSDYEAMCREALAEKTGARRIGGR